MPVCVCVCVCVCGPGGGLGCVRRGSCVGCAAQGAWEVRGAPGSGHGAQGGGVCHTSRGFPQTCGYHSFTVGGGDFVAL